jgi:hypothetical protein
MFSPGQIALDVLEVIVTEGVTTGFMSAVMKLEVAAGHAAFDVRLTPTRLPVVRVLLVNVVLLVPVLAPLTVHWYTGAAPGFTGSAVNVMGVPAQTGPTGTAEIDTEGAAKGFTTMTTGGETALNEVTHVELDVMLTVTTSPLLSVELDHVLLFAPTLTPLSCHWYTGLVPPKVGNAVNVTSVPEQIGPEGLGEIVTAGCGGPGAGLTFMEYVMLVVLGGQPLSVTATVNW